MPVAKGPATACSIATTVTPWSGGFIALRRREERRQLAHVGETVERHERAPRRAGRWLD